MTPDAGAGADPERGVMAGDGYYDRHSTTQHGAAEIGFDLLRAGAAEIDVTDPGAPTAASGDVTDPGAPTAASGDATALGDASAASGARTALTVADLGCAEGHNSLEPVAIAIDAIRRRSSRDIDVIHTDLADNDWATLFDVIEHDPASYLVGHATDVHPSVIGRSFYERMFAPASLSIAWTSSTLHWLSASPGDIPDNFFAQSSSDAAARGRYRDRAADDWMAFLACRAVELVPAASVVFVDVMMDDDGVMGSEALFDALEQSLRAARSAGRITDVEYAAIAYPTWFRSIDELRAPFAPTFVGAGGATLELVELRPGTLADPFLPAFTASADAAAYGTSQAGFLRGFLEPSFRAALLGRTPSDQTATLDAIFSDAAARIAADPHAVSPTYRLVAGRIRRAA